MSYLETVPRRLRHALSAARDHPHRAAVPVLLDGADGDQAGRATARSRTFNPFWTWRRRSSTSTSCCSKPTIRYGCGTRCWSRSAATVLSIVASVLAAYAIVRLRYRGAQWVGGAIFLAYLVPPSILFIPLVDRGLPIRPVRHAVRVDPDLSDDPDPVLDLAADGLLQDHSVRARGMRADRRRQPLADPDQDRTAALGARPDLGVHLLLHAVLERIHLRADVHLLDCRTRRCRSPSSTSSSTATSTAGAR